jgi:NAD(P)H-dependent flavin oxidoreductase YrpB (nitropropane dioxygenase family)
MDLLDRLGLEHPIAQVGMGGGMADADLAAAVSRAGALGTVGILDPRRFGAEVRRARALAPDRPIAVNLLMPFIRRAHVDAVLDAGIEAAVMFFGFDRALVDRLHAAGVVVLHQVGTVEEARRARADGADVIVAQGLQAGGHLLAREPLERILPRVLDAADGRPVFAAGGMSDAAAVRRAMDAGASGVMAGSRFLLTEECKVHRAYKQRVMGAPETLDTLLFGFGWPERHRVVPNRVTERWCAKDVRGPAAARAFNRLTAPVGCRLPLSLLDHLPRAQVRALPLYTVGPVLEGMPERLVDFTPLYAGECVRDLHSVIPAAQAVAELAVGLRPPADGGHDVRPARATVSTPED